MTRLKGHPKIANTVAVMAWVAGILAAVEVLFGRRQTGSLLGIPFWTGIPLGIVINGAVIGTLYGLVAFGIILVYKASRIINFAQAGLGSVPALIGLLLLVGRGVPYWVCVLVMLVTAVALGALVEVAIVRNFANQSRLVLTVVTIGVLQILILLESYIPKLVTGDAVAPVAFPTPFAGFRFNAGGVTLNGDYIAVVVVAGATLIALALFLRFTRIGIAIRASAENADRASMLGIPVRRVSTIVWVLASVLSGIAVFLRGPVVGLPVGGAISPSVLLYGFAAAIVARMGSLPVALGAGMALGVLDQSAVFGTSRADLSVALVLPIVLAALLLRRGTLSRAMDTGVSSFKTLKEHRPVPVELRGVTVVKRARWTGYAFVGGLALSAPYLVGTSRADFASLILIYGMLGVSLVVLSGWAGQISLGQFAFAGIGAAAAGSLATRGHGVFADFFVTLVIAGLVGAVAAVLIGLPALRVQGLFLAVVTFAFAATVQNVVLNRDFLGSLLPPSGANIGRPLIYGRLDVTGGVAYYYVCLAGLGIALLMARGLRSSRSGRVFLGVRDNVRAAQSYGISATSARLAAFAVSGFIAALAGGLYAYQQGSVDRQAFSPSLSIEVFIFAVVGGLANPGSAVAGAVVFESVRYFKPLQAVFGDNSYSSFFDTFVLSGSALLILNVAPGGLGDLFFRRRDQWLRRIAEREGILVPSLLADRRVEETDAETAAQVGLEAAAGQRPVALPQHERAPFVPSTDAVLVCRGIDVKYDSVQVLFGVDLEVRRGEILALLGTNGAGKSTLLKAISGLISPSAGTIEFLGQDVTAMDAVGMAKLRVVQVPGGKGIFPTLTVDEHFTAASWLLKNDAGVAQRREEALDRFPRLRERLDQLGGNLSGGEQQMLALSMAFLAKPDLLIIDELSLGLAPSIVGQLLELVREINAAGTAIVLVEQSVNVALTVADRAYFMEKGEVRFEGPTAELLERDDIVRSVFLEGAGGNAKPQDAPSRPRGSMVAAVRSERIQGDGAPAHVVLEARDLAVAFGGIRAVNGVSFELREGEILGLIGPNGAGKTTVFDLVSGFVPPERGAVVLLGEDVTTWAPDRRSRAGLGRSFQDARIFSSMTVAENIALSLERHLAVRDHLAASLGLPEVREVEEDVAWSVADLIDLMSLGAFRDKFVGELSTGSRRVVDLAMAIAHDPAVLVLDEPSSGIAQAETEALGPLLRRIRDETGCGMLVIEHDMPLITDLSDRLLALELGAVIAEGLPHDVISDPRVVSSYLGGDVATVNRSRSGSAAKPRKSART
jgi:ABC-type branched-subunit amino acid transport system ATPase component/ABC-type branched-subunit amino acid transport system permease subunit